MKFCELTESEFESFAESFPESSFLQSVPMARRRQEVGWSHYFVGMRSKNGKIVAAALLYSWPVVGKYQQFECLQGPLVDFTNAPLAQEFVHNITSFARKHHALSITINPNVAARHWSEDREVIDDGYTVDHYERYFSSRGYTKLSAARVDHDSIKLRWYFVKNLKELTSPDMLMDSFSQRTRRAVRKSLKSGIHVRQIELNELPVYLSILADTEGRKGFDGRDAQYYSSLVTHFGSDRVQLMVAELDYAEYKIASQSVLEKLEASLADDTDKKSEKTIAQITAAIHTHKDRLKHMAENSTERLPIAAATFVVYGNQVTYLTGGSLREYASYNAPYALHWYAMQYAMKHKIPEYNFYGTKGNHCNVPDQEGVYAFKAGFGGVLEEQLGYFVKIFRPDLMALKKLHSILKKIV